MDYAGPALPVVAVIQNSQPILNFAGLTFPDLTTVLAHRLPGISVTRSEDEAPQQEAPQAQQPPATTPGGASTGRRALNTPASARRPARKKHYCPVDHCGFNADRVGKVRRHVLAGAHFTVPEDIPPSVIVHLQGQLPNLVPYQDTDSDTEVDHLALADLSNEALALAYLPTEADGNDLFTDTDTVHVPAESGSHPAPSRRQTARKSTSSRPPVKAEPDSQ